jgi:hypothetical protein
MEQLFDLDTIPTPIIEYTIGKVLTLMPNNFTIFGINTSMRFGIIVILLLAANIALAQADNKKGKANMLSKQEASKIFTEDVKGKLKITFPVMRTYSYSDTAANTIWCSPKNMMV